MTKHRLSTAVAVGATCVALSFGATPALADTAAPQGSSERHLENFTDNPKGSQYYTPVRWMQKEGVSKGYTDGSYGKYRDISRGESVAFIYRYIDPDFEAEGDPFEDVTEDSNFYHAISWAKDWEVALGYSDGNFKSGQSVTRGEFVAFVYRAKDPNFKVPKDSDFPDVPTNNTHFEAISWAAAKGIVTGNVDKTFRPSDPITRAEVAQIIYNGATKAW
jgi:hypothetical protein